MICAHFEFFFSGMSEEKNEMSIFYHVRGPCQPNNIPQMPLVHRADSKKFNYILGEVGLLVAFLFLDNGFSELFTNHECPLLACAFRESSTLPIDLETFMVELSYR